jgi:hypothetical protein
MLARLSPARRRFVVGLALLAALAALGTTAATLLNRKTAAAPVDQARLGPVLLVPGVRRVDGRLSRVGRRAPRRGA